MEPRSGSSSFRERTFTTSDGRLKLTTKTRIGIFGGSFDPPHLGHLHLLKEVQNQFCFDFVYIVPSKYPHGKTAGADYQKRLSWCEKIFSAPWMKISNLEENASQSVFAREIFYQLSLQRPEATYYWILGEDQLNQLPYWNRIDDYASQLEWVALSRDRDHHLGVSGPRSRRLISSTCRYFWAVIERRMAISSTEIRENLLNKSGDIPSEIRADVIDFYKNLKIKE